MTSTLKLDSRLTHLPRFNNRNIDIRPEDLNFSRVGLAVTDEIDEIYKRIAIALADMFEAKGLVEIESFVYNINLHGRVIHHQVNVLGRSPETGQRYSVYLM